MLRRRVRQNMLLALGDDVPPDAEILYFRRLGWFLASALAVFHHGTKASAVFDEIKFDQSIRRFKLPAHRTLRVSEGVENLLG